MQAFTLEQLRSAAKAGDISMTKDSKAVEYDKWFRAQVAQGLAEANDPNTQWVTHETVQANWAKKRAELVKQIDVNNP